ncbi:Active breakpoint cluster region-related protein [Anabarilius grahami]|uniref:Active breakpoint cluster region-related protein n=1 Tax=Anabarilius grahami TaxID=495550 RepID=A0A3N0XCW3_ANAGA|nr:Active breakpoint cluster region-related protein [Anabarilius grahami]
MEEDEDEVLGLLDKVLEDEDLFDNEMDLDCPFTPMELRTFKGDMEKGLEMKKLVLSGFLASEEIYINQLEALLLSYAELFSLRALCIGTTPQRMNLMFAVNHYTGVDTLLQNHRFYILEV